MTPSATDFPAAGVRAGVIFYARPRRRRREPRAHLQLEMKAASNRGVSPRLSLGEGGFTLLELLVVIGLIAVFSFFIAGGLTGGSKSAALQSAQATMANLVTAARTKAAVSGCRVRILINADASDLGRFRRTIALQQETTLNSNIWNDPTLVTSFPEGVFILPYRNRIPAGFYDTQSNWVKYNSTNPLSLRPCRVRL